MEWVTSILGTFSEHGPWVIVGVAIATVTYAGAAFRSLQKNVWHFETQCHENRTTIREQCANTEKVVREQYTRAVEVAGKWEAKYDRAMDLVMHGSGTILKGAETVEHLVKTALPDGIRPKDGDSA